MADRTPKTHILVRPGRSYCGVDMTMDCLYVDPVGEAREMWRTSCVSCRKNYDKAEAARHLFRGGRNA